MLIDTLTFFSGPFQATKVMGQLVATSTASTLNFYFFLCCKPDMFSYRMLQTFYKPGKTLYPNSFLFVVDGSEKVMHHLFGT